MGRRSVNHAREKLGNPGQLAEISHSRQLVCEYYEKNPDASYREIARETGVDDKTVGVSTSRLERGTRIAREMGTSPAVIHSRDRN